MKHAPRKMLYWDWLAQEAALIHADGCTGGTNYQGKCCLQHDVEGWHGANAASAYHGYLHDVADVWAVAEPITFEQWNRNFRNCLFRHSRFGYWNPLAWVRYAVVRSKKGRAAWDAHRAARPVETV